VMTACGATGPRPMVEGNDLYQLRDVGLRYRAADGQHIEALRRINCSVARGEFIAFIGPSGCGKTTLLKVLSGLIAPSCGEVRFAGRKLDGPPEGIGIAFQDSLLLPWRNVIDNVLLPIEVLRLPRQRFLAKAHELLAVVGLKGFERKASWQLSGGMRQRASLCRALINDPQVLLLDEPFGALDAFTREELWLVLQDLHRRTQGTTILITHHLHEAVFLADRVAVLSARPAELVYEAEIDFPKPRSRDVAYSAEFIAHVDTLRRMIDR
jgi:NitT/TauT family transport system ATP-binding protein